MNKLEAAEYLGISERTLLRYVKNGRIGCAYVKQKGKRSIVTFDLVEIQELKLELEQELIHPAIKEEQKKEDIQTQLEHITTALEFLCGLLSQMQASQDKKMTLTLAEASALSGLSQNFLKIHIKKRELPGKKLGRCWLVKPEDLKEFVDDKFRHYGLLSISSSASSNSFSMMNSSCSKSPPSTNSTPFGENGPFS